MPDRWPALEPGVLRLNQQLKTKLDPHRVFQ
jgi:hypothetical protein